jgi:hypothetical protein
MNLILIDVNNPDAKKILINNNNYCLVKNAKGQIEVWSYADFLKYWGYKERPEHKDIFLLRSNWVGQPWILNKKIQEEDVSSELIDSVTKIVWLYLADLNTISPKSISMSMVKNGDAPNETLSREYVMTAYESSNYTLPLVIYLANWYLGKENNDMPVIPPSLRLDNNLIAEIITKDEIEAVKNNLINKVVPLESFLKDRFFEKEAREGIFRKESEESKKKKKIENEIIIIKGDNNNNGTN